MNQTAYREQRVREVVAALHERGHEVQYENTGGNVWLGLLYLDGARLMFDLEPADDAPGLYWRCTWEAPHTDDLTTSPVQGYNVDHETRPDPDASLTDITWWLIDTHLTCERRYAADQHAQRKRMRLEAY